MFVFVEQAQDNEQTQNCKWNAKKVAKNVKEDYSCLFTF